MDIYFNKKNPQEVELQNQNPKNNNKKDPEEGKRLNPDNKKNPFENYNENEAHEKRMHDRLDGSDPKLTIAYRNNIEFDMSNRKREIRMKKEDKVEMEKMRRWAVKINNIYITPLVKMIDPFLQFTVGGNFMVNVYKNKKGETYKIPAGKRGYTDKTEVLLNVNTPQEDGQGGGRTPFRKVIEIEMRMSYSMINKQKIMVELWEHNNFWMNEIHSYLTFPLIDIVNGNSNVGEFMLKRESGRKNPIPFAYVEFNCVFQEIWDFNLGFMNWKSSNLLNPKRKANPNAEKPSTKVEIELLSSVASPMNSKTVSEEVKKSTNPIWSKFNNKLLFRGTASELENENVKITLYETSGIFNRQIASKVVGLRGVVDFERLKTEMLVKDDGELYPITVEGLVSIDNKPKYKQIGQNVMLLSSRKYLVLKIMRVENIRPAETRGIVDSFISVEWCGMNQRTRTVKENNNPSFNELLYFQVPIQEEWLNNIDKYLLKINEEHATKNEVSFNLMIEGDDNTYDNFGIGYFYLSEIKGGNKMQEKFYAEDLKQEKKYLSEKYTGKIKLVSAFSQSNNTFLHFEAWFLENFPPQVDFGEKKKKSERADKVPLELNKYFPKGKDVFFNKEFKSKIYETFLKYSNYPCKDRMFTNLTPQDQYTNTHLLPYFLSPITVPEKKYARKDIETDPNFFDCNITTLYEAAHYARCFPFPQDLKNDIWSSPDFMLKLRKGNVEEHAILMACLMLGLKKRNVVGKGYKSIEDLIEIPGEDSKDDETGGLIGKEATHTCNPTTGNPLITSNDTKVSGQDNQVNIEEIDTGLQVDTFPYENLIFVCQGKLRETKAPHTWVMSISKDYRDITFWDPKLFVQFELRGRVKDPEKLKNFLNGKYANYEAVNKNILDDGPQKNKNEDKNQKKPKRADLDNVVLKGQNNDSIVEYVSDDDIIDINLNDSGRNKIHNNNMVDELIANQVVNNDDSDANNFNFIEHDKTVDDEINKGNEKNFLPVDIFKVNGQPVQDIVLPYETIDLIFNQNNIYANCQFHSPDQIYYNLYEKSQWLPYIKLENGNIWRGKFEPFYSICNFGPVYSPFLVKKMTDALIKEMRVGIAAARSGKNLPTRFKKKNEVINKQLGKYLDFLENRHLNRISEKEFIEKKQEWEVVVKKYMPKFYRMEAQAIFFNFFETEIIRREITDDLEEFWYSKIKNVVFATSAKVYAYPNQVVSVRIMLAKIYRIPLEDITNKEEEKEYEEMLKEDPNKLVEEEIDSDEEEDKRIAEQAAKEAAEAATNNPNTEEQKDKKKEGDDVERKKIVEEPITIDNKEKQ